LASKKYTSLVRLFQHLDIDIHKELNLQRIRKQILLEFAITEHGIISLNEVNFNKNDILEEIDREDFLHRWGFHLQIWDRRQILALLEDDYIDLDHIGSELNEFRNNKEFITFFSPYFSFSFNSMAKTLLAPPKLGKLGLLLNYKDFIIVEDTEFAFSSIYRFLLDQKKLLNNVSKETYHLHSKALAHWTNSNWGEFLDQLPDVFYSEKEDIVASLINLTVALQSNSLKTTKAISHQLVKINNIDYQHHKLIRDNHKIYTEENKSYWWVFWVVLVLGRIFAGC
jgi:hypothetical protein